MNYKGAARVTLANAIHRKGDWQTDRERLRREEQSDIEPELDLDEGRICRQRLKQPCRARNSRFQYDSIQIRFTSFESIKK